MNKSGGRRKREVLHYRQAGDSSTCTECEHREKMNCAVMDGPIHYDMRCNAWNNGETENTWHCFVHSIKDKTFVLIKEEKCTVGRAEIQLPVESIDKEVCIIFEKCTKALGCPDFVCNISPRKYNSLAFKNWLGYRSIQYRELDAEIDKMEFKVDDDMNALEVLSLMIDVAVVYPNEEEKDGNQ